jgi:hypothetical protein
VHPQAGKAARAVGWLAGWPKLVRWVAGWLAAGTEPSATETQLEEEQEEGH